MHLCSLPYEEAESSSTGTNRPEKRLATPVQTVTGKEFSNPFKAEALPKSLKKVNRSTKKDLSSPQQTARGKDISNPLTADHLLKVNKEKSSKQNWYEETVAEDAVSDICYSVSRIP